ncbi:hypothetical protein [Aureibacter tunicatorum]|uniref:Uncharacterized protein n=1 Tax=Aureibacter tunicatorum TaxID=866807 RepID=A0AAE4BQL6_9BACT|nr:hypothetical protein [Aureibacter tunicatorum]MDR6237701.1 hypothetical protein [Aureibacter tunicatorum]BDD02736.1 hypothetical protein AUTU_02190 [Aureibacter tunicatorum]
MAIISKKKLQYPISSSLNKYLTRYSRSENLPIEYDDLLRFDNAIPLHDKNDEDTLWETVYYSPLEMEYIHHSLKEIYAYLKSGGDLSVIEHLYIERIDLCIYGNTKPFRIRIVNKINDLFDYFYIKKIDASRVYGLELEHLLSPNTINFLVNKHTLVEEHIQGIPGDQFIKKFIKSRTTNEIRLAKEFVKFNERCFVRLLGDMHSCNFVIEIIPDFDEIHYRIRPIDFDQQSYEGRRVIYLPQYFKENNPIIKLGLKHITPELELQYQKEERARLSRRYQASKVRMKRLLSAMGKDEIAKEENIDNLKKELHEIYQDKSFLKCSNMGEIVQTSLEMLIKQPTRKRPR